MSSYQDIEFKAIPNVSDWGKRKPVAMALVELRNIVNGIDILLNKYRVECGNTTPSGSGFLYDLIALFDETLPTCFKEVNKLKENQELMTIANQLEAGRKALHNFLVSNHDAAKASPAKIPNVKKLLDVLVKLERAIATTISRIIHVVSYYNTSSVSGSESFPI